MMQHSRFLPTSTSCINLIFTSQSNLVVDSDTQSSQNPKYHHQITYCKLNLNIKYPLPYQRLVWDYKITNVESFKWPIELVNLETLFHQKTIHKQVSIFNETLMVIFSNFIPNKYTKFNDRDPPWINDFVKTKTKFENQLYNTYRKNSYKDNDSNMLQEAIDEVSKTISKGKEDYHHNLGSKINNPSASAKAYQSMLKTFHNGEKVLFIPQFQIGNTLVADFKMRVNIFNQFFASRCFPLNNSSNIPYCQRYTKNAKICSMKFEK